VNEWRRLKDYGMSAFRARRAKADELMIGLSKVGIVPVQVGELEGFAPALNIRKGDAWLEEALTSGAHKASAAQEHLRLILAAGGFGAESVSGGDGND
jgi:hypothetical protein